jgi:hypothetical protein
LAGPDFYIRQLKHRIALLEEQPERVFDANDMKTLIGNAAYEGYREAAKTPLAAQAYPVSQFAQGWAESAEQLLKEVNAGLNLHHIVLDCPTGAQRLRAENFKSRAEELMLQFDNSIRDTPDCIAFTIHEDPSSLAATEPYYEAHRLLEHWVLPSLNKTVDAGTDRHGYIRELQSQFLTDALARLQPPEPQDTSRLDALRKTLTKNRWFD